MASRGAIAAMDAEVRDRIRLATGRLSKRLGIDAPADPAYARQPELARVYELQTHADFLEALDGAIKGEGYSAAAGESLADKQEAADAAVSAEDAADTTDAEADAGTQEAAPMKTTRKAKA
jgi:hypothetical protein